MKQKTFVEYTGGPLYFNDNHFNDEEELFDYYEVDGVDVFEAELCDIKKLGHDLNVGSIVESMEIMILRDCDPEHDWKVAGLGELQEALEKLKECQTQNVCVPNGKFVRLERPKEES